MGIKNYVHVLPLFPWWTLELFFVNTFHDMVQFFSKFGVYNCITPPMQILLLFKADEAKKKEKKQVGHIVQQRSIKLKK